DGFIDGSRRKLGNEKFTGRAPAEVVDREQALLAENETRADALRKRLTALG
nr:hypothetical protein [bacterium]